MRPSDAAALLAPRKQPFAREIFQRLTAIPGVRSVTFVGSFCDREELSGISDIDVVVVCEALDRALFDACSAAMAGVSPALLGLPSHRLYLNTTFGPLKFDQPDQVVIHLMIYDRASHRTHVLKSPFTCLDWERSPVGAGETLAELYPVLTLQPGDFLNARRSLANYTDDLRRGVLSYRRYEFSESGVREKLEQAQLDERLRGEYAFHIVKNLVQNYAKLVRRENACLTTDELIGFWRESLPDCAAFADEFLRLQAAKLRRDPVFSAATVDFAKNFMAAFEAEFTRRWSTAQRLVFARHAQTELNDGTFLGQGRDPGILTPPPPLAQKYSKVFCSPLRRTRDTALALQPDATLEVDRRLAEINYGEIEGLPISQLATRHPELVAAWSRGEDAPFPGGENTAAVQGRLQDFLDAIHDETASPVLVVTHNVVIRCLLGELLGVPLRDWHKLRVNHLDAFEVIRRGDRLYLSLTEAQKAALIDSLLKK
jgi:broad specificity phosphatase PhoE